MHLDIIQENPPCVFLKDQYSNDGLRLVKDVNTPYDLTDTHPATTTSDLKLLVAVLT